MSGLETLSALHGVRAGFSLGRERLRGVTAPLVLVLSAGVVYALGVLERRAETDGAPDRVLTSVVFGLALPLFSYLVSERACDGQRLDSGLLGVARYGVDRRAALLGLLLISALYLALMSAVLTVFGLLGAHAPGTVGLARDLLISIGVALASGSVYALWFGAASLVGKRGGGRKWALIFDFVFGAGGSALAAPWPRGHVRNLLGGSPVLDLSQRGAWFALGAIGLFSVVLSLARTPE